MKGVKIKIMPAYAAQWSAPASLLCSRLCHFPLLLYHHIIIQIFSEVSDVQCWIAVAIAFAPSVPMLLPPIDISSYDNTNR